MEAIVINLKDRGVQTPEQVVRVFFELYDHESVQVQLWEAFRLYAINDEKGLSGLNVNEAKLAQLFDHLVDLVRAVELLRVLPGTGRNVIGVGKEEVIKGK